MDQIQHRAMQFIGPLKELAEGHLRPEDWLAWWDAHSSEVEAACPRGWVLKLKPRQLADSGRNRATWNSQEGACFVLGELKVPFTRSDRYEKAWNADFAQYCAAKGEEERSRAQQMAPVIAAVAHQFPKFARFLKRREGDIERLEGPATEQEIAAWERSFGVALPDAVRRFLLCTKGLTLPGLSLGQAEVFPHPGVIADVGNSKPTICIGEYFLEADGDQVLIERTAESADDRPVYYYAHSESPPAVRRLAKTFTAWIESLPKSALFRDG